MQQLNQMPAHASVWVYQSNRELSAAEKNEILEKADDFVSSWTAHGNALKAALEIRYNRFLLMSVDERQAGATGCSLDKLSHFIQGLEKEYDISLLDRMLVAFRQDDDIISVKLPEFERLIDDGEITDRTIVFNNLVNTRAGFEKHWEVQLKDSWHSKYL